MSACVDQLVARWTHNPDVAGSILTVSAQKSKCNYGYPAPSPRAVLHTLRRPGRRSPCR